MTGEVLPLSPLMRGDTSSTARGAIDGQNIVQYCAAKPTEEARVLWAFVDVMRRTEGDYYLEAFYKEIEKALRSRGVESHASGS